MIIEHEHLISDEDLDKIQDSIAALRMYLDFVEDEVEYLNTTIKEIKSETE